MLNPLRKSEVIFHNAGGIQRSPSVKFPYTVEVDLKWPEFHSLVYAMRYGGCETVVIVGTTLKVLERRIKKMKLREHPRLLDLTISGPDGVIEKFSPRSRA